MRIFLIDYENVNSSGLAGISMLSAEDRVILLYSHSANTVSFEIFDELLQSSVMPERIQHTQTGKNALDFQLVAYLGYLIAKESADEYYIISRDCGYQSTIAFCADQLHTTVQMKPSIQAALSGAKAKPAAKRLSVKKKKASVRAVQPAALEAPTLPTAQEIIDSLDTPIAEETLQELLECMRISRNESEFHNALQNTFRNESAKYYYHCLKRFFRRYKSSY